MAHWHVGRNCIGRFKRSGMLGVGRFKILLWNVSAGPSDGLRKLLQTMKEAPDDGGINASSIMLSMYVFRASVALQTISEEEFIIFIVKHKIKLL